MLDRLAEHEAFLRAIFNAPDDDTPRLVYADFLEENDEPMRAELIRVQCQLAHQIGDRHDLERREAVLLDRLDVGQTFLSASESVNGRQECLPHVNVERGFCNDPVIVLDPAQLNDPEMLRRTIVRSHPHWFAAKQLTIASGRMLIPENIPILFELPASTQIAEWNLSGSVEEIAAGQSLDDAGTYSLLDIEIRPAIGLAAIAALCNCRKARRLRALDLRYNNLDNDTARALINSPHLINLERLDLLDGSRVRGRTWQQLRERFGENVVG